MKEFGIYIHIPFCLRKCLYCDFLSGPAPGPVRAGYVRALCREMEGWAAYYKEYTAETVFLGGGTPSLLSVGEIRQIFSCLREHYRIAAEAEITMEMNPGTVTDRKLAACREAGVNRVSLGLQSASDTELCRLGRVHTWKDFLQSYRLCRDAGFENINVDLMSALPGQTYSSWMDTLEKTAALEPEHISAYSLIIEEGTPFYDLYGPAGGGQGRGGAGQDKGGGQDRDGGGQDKGGAGPDTAPAPLPDEETERAMYAATKTFLTGCGYERYEISNYGRPGKECRHNCLYWTRGEYAGFGLGAASMADNRRWSDERELQAYLDRWSRTEQMTPEIYPRLSVREQIEETMYLGLRMMRGVSGASFRRTFGRDMEEIYGPVLDKYTSLGLLKREGDSVSLTDRGIDVSNHILADFLLD